MKKIIFTIALGISTFLSLNAQCFPDRHSTNWFDGWMSCNPQASPDPNLKAGHWLLFDLGKRYSIRGIRIWNYNDPDLLARGISKLSIHYSGDSIRWYHDRDLDLDPAPGHNRYEGMDWKSLTIPEAKYILLTALENFGASGCYGLGEVMFEAEEVIISDNLDETASEIDLKVRLLPNPFSRQFQAEIDLIPDQMATWQVTDLMGRKWASGSLHSLKSKYYLRVLSENWPAGNYVFSINQGELYAKSLVVKIN